MNILLQSAKSINIKPPSFIYFFGDSITQGVGATSNIYRYSTLVSSELSINELNGGLSGSALQESTSSVEDGINRYEIINSYPRDAIIVILYGINDCIKNTTINADFNGYERDIREIISSIINFKYKNRIFLCSLTPNSNLNATGISMLNSINQLNKDISEEFNISFIDVYQHLEDNGGVTNFPDGTHPNNTGHQLIADVIKSKIMTII